MTQEEEYRELLHSIADDLSRHPECRNMKDCQAYVMTEFSKCLHKMSDFADSLVRMNQEVIDDKAVSGAHIQNMTRLSNAMTDSSIVQQRMMNLLGYEKVKHATGRTSDPQSEYILFRKKVKLLTEAQRKRRREIWEKHLKNHPHNKPGHFSKRELKKAIAARKGVYNPRSRRPDGSSPWIESLVRAIQRPEAIELRNQKFREYCEVKSQGPEALAAYKKRKEAERKKRNADYHREWRRRKREERDNILNKDKRNDTELSDKQCGTC